MDNEILILFKNGKRGEWTKTAFNRLSDKKKAEWTKAGEKIAQAGEIKVTQHKGKAQKVITIDPLNVEAVTEKEPVKEPIKEPVKEPVADLESEIAATDRLALKEWFLANPNDTFYLKMPTKKMYELYKSLNDVSKE